MFLRLWITASLVMLIDSVLLTVGLRLGDPDLWPTFASGLAAKLAGATFYAFALALYLRYVDKHGRGDDRRALEPRRLPPADLPAALRKGAEVGSLCLDLDGNGRCGHDDDPFPINSRSLLRQKYLQSVGHTVDDPRSNVETRYNVSAKTCFIDWGCHQL